MELAGYLMVLIISGASAYFVYGVEKGASWAKQVADGLAMQDPRHVFTLAQHPSSADIRTLRPRKPGSGPEVLIRDDYNDDRAA